MIEWDMRAVGGEKYVRLWRGRHKDRQRERGKRVRDEREWEKKKR